LAGGYVDQLTIVKLSECWSNFVAGNCYIRYYYYTYKQFMCNMQIMRCM